MKLRHLLPAAVSAVIILLSCQKEYDPGVPVIPPPVVTNSDSNYLDKVYDVDSIGGVKDTTYIQVYFYDAQKRVINVNDSVREAGVWVLLNTKNYLYNSSDTLPFKTTEYHYNTMLPLSNPAACNDSLTSYYQYNNSGKRIYDSVIHLFPYGGPTFEKGVSVAHYQYDGNKIYGDDRTVYSMAGASVIEYRDTAQLDARGNVASSKRYVPAGSNWVLEVNAVFTYDDHPSPYARLSLLKTLDVVPVGEDFISTLQSVNNRLKALEQFINPPGTYDEDLTNKYSYNSNGYPSRVKDFDVTTPTDAYITLFTYRSL